jgi:hypothetical protein
MKPIRRNLLPFPYFSHPQAISFRLSGLRTFLQKLTKLLTHQYIVATMEYKLSVTLNIPFDPQFANYFIVPQEIKSILLTAIKHQNLIGWDSFLKGYTSTLWHKLSKMNPTTQNEKPTTDNWDVKLVGRQLTFWNPSGMIGTNLYMAIHGLTKKINYVREYYPRFNTFIVILLNCTTDSDLFNLSLWKTDKKETPHIYKDRSNALSIRNRYRHYYSTNEIEIN